MELSRAAKIKSNLLNPLSGWMLLVCATVLLACLLQTLFPAVLESLRWQPAALSQEYWRLLSGHFVHLSVVHGLLNVAACLLTWRLFALDWQTKDVALMLLSLPLTGALLFYGQLSWYVGLSGALHGWFLLGAWRAWPRQPMFAGLLLLGLAAKLYWEPQNPVATTEAQWLGGPVAYVAHQLGSLAMIILLILQFAAAKLWDRVRG